MRSLLLVLCFTAGASAQSPLFPDGTAGTRAAAHWRIAASGGFANAAQTGTGSLSVERTHRSALALGARAAMYSGGGFTDDGSETDGGSLEAFGSVGTRDRVFDLRALAGGGMALAVHRQSPFGCREPSERECPEVNPNARLYPYPFVGAGLDLFPLAGVGLGVEVRLSPSLGPIDFSSIEAGLRVRLARRHASG